MPAARNLATDVRDLVRQREEEGPPPGGWPRLPDTSVERARRLVAPYEIALALRRSSMSVNRPPRWLCTLRFYRRVMRIRLRRALPWA